MTHMHEISITSERMLSKVYRAGREMRYWFAADGQLVGIWKTPRGLTVAVGHGYAYGKNVVVYRTSPL